MTEKLFDPNVWGPHYWFVLHTITLGYPLLPNDISKKKYYEFIHNIPLFIPVKQIGDKFSIILDKYPVAPSLDSRDSLIKWFHFIHNKINILKKTLLILKVRIIVRSLKFLHLINY